MSENLSPVTAETSDSEDDTDSSKSKSKKKALGAFVVEVEPPKKKETSLFGSADKPESSIFGKRQSTEIAASSGKDDKAAEKSRDGAAEDLVTDEKVAAVQQLAAARRAELETEASAAETPTSDAEMAAATAFLIAAEALGDSQAAYQQIAAELAAPIDLETEGEIDLHSSGSEAGVNDEPEEPSETEPTTSNPASTGATPPPPRGPAGPPPSGNGSAANTPPRGPGGTGTPPPTGGPGGAGRPGGPGGGPGGYPYNNVPLAPNPSAPGASVPIETARANERLALTDGLIVGGIVGYLYGRRRGRIKTEKRLAPVQRKLEKQVKSLQTELLQNETAIRLQARKLQQAQPQAAARISERWQAEAQRHISSPRAERLMEHAVVPPERLGHVMVAASAAANAERLGAASKLTKPESVTAKKRAETMSRSELLALSETVQVDGTSLRRIYETQLISEKALRRLVTEHLRGGNVARALKRELVEHDIDFERDPIFRDRGSGAKGASVSGAGKTALSGLLQQAGLNDRAQSQPIGPAAKKRDSKTQKAAAIAKKRRQSLIDGALITLITVLVFVIVVVLRRG